MKRQQAERPACTSVNPLSFHSIQAVASRETRRLDQRQLLESRQVYQSAQTSTIQRPFAAISSWQFLNRDSSAIALHCTAVALRHCLHCPSRTPTAIALRRSTVARRVALQCNAHATDSRPLSLRIFASPVPTVVPMALLSAAGDGAGDDYSLPLFPRPLKWAAP